ncbi:MAG: M64 family metallopeptidase [Algibacter sp.]|uniref:T9SS type A sorting domain-containing protein n=1 Tax=Algibacter sp. TaxID=1872428 RepID=UPI00262105B1|nr:M64 family metallopeptidase [Algibacter sp.]MDG1728751.1 M64 family metallopeptidase [Algibacter sp.]MDG2177790.1 M64 family metallopeptidase [Algibacter sp.]
MKSFLCFLLFTCNLLFLHAQVFDVEPIKVTGDNDKRISLVIMGDGYTVNELDKFITDATNFSNSMFSKSPLKEYADYFNVYAIKVPSNESGADHPGTGSTYFETNWPVPTTNVDTFFNATFDSFGNHFLLFYEVDGNYANNTEAKIINVLADNFPTYDQALILVNSPYYGGSGGTFPMASTGISSDELAIHELGHSLFDLKDEYYPGDLLAAEAVNMTHVNNINNPRWNNWIGTDNVGVYQHTCSSGNCSDWYKPNTSCKMEVLNNPFCSVCKEGIIEKIHSLASPIDAYTPNNNTVDNLTFPLDFQLNLIKPDPNTLESEWILNAVSYADNVDDVSILETDLAESTNTLTAVVHDNSPFLRVDNHDSLHVYTVTWTINYSSLGVDDIESKMNNFNISLYPNPTYSILNLKFESSTSSNLKVDIISLDGKKVKSANLSSYENTQVDIGNLSQGVYVTNFYSGNVLIASKRLVKN